MASLRGNEWERALFTFDEQAIRAVAKKYGVTMPTNNELFWFTVAGAVLRSKESYPFEILTAKEIINQTHSKLLRRAYAKEGTD